MKLPQNLQHFPHETLIIVSDHAQAKFFLVGGDELQELDGISDPRERSSDREGKFVSDISDAPRLSAFTKMVAERAEALCKEHDILHLDLVLPAEVEKPFLHAAPTDLKARIRKTVHHDLIQESPLRIVERLLAL